MNNSSNFYGISKRTIDTYNSTINAQEENWKVLRQNGEKK